MLRRYLVVAVVTLLSLVIGSASHAQSAARTRPAPDACADAGEALCIPIRFRGEVPVAQDGERLIAFGRALARGSNAPVRIEGPGAGDRLLPNAVPTLSQMRAEKVARLLEAGGLPWDRIERVSGSRWRVIGP